MRATSTRREEGFPGYVEEGQRWACWVLGVADGNAELGPRHLDAAATATTAEAALTPDQG